MNQEEIRNSNSNILQLKIHFVLFSFVAAVHVVAVVGTAAGADFVVFLFL